MAWARIDDNFFNHPKVRKAGKDAIIFHMAALCHSNAFTTDGFIADDLLDLIAAQAFQRKAKALADLLVDCNLWDRVEGGYLIHDFLEYNYSKQQVNEIKSKRSDAGKQGGRPRQTKPKANEKQNESKIEPNPKQSESHTHTHINTHTDTELTTTAGTTFSDVAKAYEDVCGVLNSVTADKLKLAYREYEPSWIVDALKETAVQNKRSWAYTEAILKRWQKEGRNSKRAPVKPDERSADTFRKARQQMRQA